MASVNENAVSFTGTTAQNISKPPREGVSGRDSFTAVAAMQMSATKSQHHPLPTPPNSISPNLPPHGLKAARGKSLTNLDHLDQVDSDLELLDGASEGLVSLSRDAFAALSPDADNTSFDTAGNITPALLAKHHLPEILLNNGPLAIRHVMGFLTTSVPGFSGIPPAKARRLVVGALEGRGNNGEGGLNGDVQFEKVGWGRWDAKFKGHASRKTRPGQISLSPPPSLPSSFSGTVGVPISGPAHSYTRTRLENQSSSWADGSDAVFCRDSDEDIMMLEDIADKMSLDGNDDGSGYSSSEAAPDGDELMDDDPNDLTDDEDWAAVGAAALRQSSYNPSIQTRNNFLSTKTLYPGFSSYGGARAPFAMAKSAPMFVHKNPTANMNEVMNMGGASNYDTYGNFSFGVSDAQEREAVEALLRLGSV